MDALTNTSTMTVYAKPSEMESEIAIWVRILPLWRYGIWFGALFLLIAVAIVVRLDVQRLQMDLDRNDRLSSEAMIIQERLDVELNVRTRLGAVQVFSEESGLERAPTRRVLDGVR